LRNTRLRVSDQRYFGLMTEICRELDRIATAARVFGFVISREQAVAPFTSTFRGPTA